MKSADDLNCDLLAQDVKKNYGIKTKVVSNLSDLREGIDEMICTESVIAVFSNGTCLGLWNSDFVKELKDAQ